MAMVYCTYKKGKKYTATTTFHTQKGMQNTYVKPKLEHLSITRSYETEHIHLAKHKTIIWQNIRRTSPSAKKKIMNAVIRQMKLRNRTWNQTKWNRYICKSKEKPHHQQWKRKKKHYPNPYLAQNHPYLAQNHHYHSGGNICYSSIERSQGGKGVIRATSVDKPCKEPWTQSTKPQTTGRNWRPHFFLCKWGQSMKPKMMRDEGDRRRIGKIQNR